MEDQTLTISQQNRLAIVIAIILPVVLTALFRFLGTPLWREFSPMEVPRTQLLWIT